MYPIDTAQQCKLMSFKEIAERQVTCSFTISLINSKKRSYIRISDPGQRGRNSTNTSAKGLSMRGRPEILSETIILAFANAIPDRVKMAAMSFQVQISVLSPVGAENAGKSAIRPLGATQKKTIEEMRETAPVRERECITRCINCTSPNHEADCDKCPEYE